MIQDASSIGPTLRHAAAVCQQLLNKLPEQTVMSSGLTFGFQSAYDAGKHMPGSF